LDPKIKVEGEQHIASHAIRDWKTYPKLATIFGSVVEYAEYLKNDFNAQVEREKKGRNSEVAAIRKVIAAHPDIHAKYVKVLRLKGGVD
jgi:hypothetical protein